MQSQVLDNRYVLEEKIGDGGMARVYAGRDLRLNRRVAIKIPLDHLTSDPDFLSRFRHEAQAAAILTHPNIVDVYDVGQDGDTHYIVMEYVDGINLKTLINREGPLPVARAAAIAEEIARGLYAAHRIGMVHRDVKPQNIIISPEGNVQITDFGVAKSHLSTAMTETGISFGTVDYISPEQAQGRPATPQSDIYALGVTLYEMLTGRLPFTGDSSVAVAMKHVTEQPISPRQYNPQIPLQFEALVLRAMAKDPAQRPTSALEFARQLSAFRTIAAQETVVNPGVVRREAAPGNAPQPVPQVPPQPVPQRPARQTSQTSGTPMPPPRPTMARAPRSEGVGCGTFVVGMLILGGVVGLILLFSSGVLADLFPSGVSQAGSRTVVALAPSAQATGTPTETPTETPTPTTTPEPVAAVPNLVGLTDGAARSALRQAGLEPAPSSENNNAPQGIVFAQAVAPNTELLEGETVGYTVSLGPNLVALPDFTNTRAADARSSAQALGFQVNIIDQPSRNVTTGFVIRQSPNVGARISPGETIDLTVSVGDTVRFPDIIGLQRDQAERILRNTAELTLVFVDLQGRDRLGDFDNYRPNEVVSAAIDDRGVNNGDFVPRDSDVVLGVRAP